MHCAAPRQRLNAIECPWCRCPHCCWPTLRPAPADCLHAPAPSQSRSGVHPQTPRTCSCRGFCAQQLQGGGSDTGGQGATHTRVKHQPVVHDQRIPSHFPLTVMKAFTMADQVQDLRECRTRILSAAAAAAVGRSWCVGHQHGMVPVCMHCQMGSSGPVGGRAEVNPPCGAAGAPHGSGHSLADGRVPAPAV